MKQRLIHLDPKDYEHSFDRNALSVVKALPILPQAVNFIMNWTAINWRIIAMCGNSFKVTRDACPDLAVLGKEVFNTLNLDYKPDLYVQQDYYINAYTTGHQEKAFIALSSGAVDRLSDEELSFIIGHESGHIKSGHVLYHMMLAYITVIMSRLPGSSVLQVPLMYWNRMSEFTADRAGLLACQDLDVALSTIMKMSGLPEKYYKTASVEGFMQQARDFMETNSHGANSVMRVIEILDEDHPWTVVRAAELIKWYESGEYQKVLDKNQGKECPVCHSNVPVDTQVCPFCDHAFEG